MTMATAVSACFVRAGRVGGAEHALYNLLDGLAFGDTARDPWTVVTAEPLQLGFDLAPLRDAARARSRACATGSRSRR